MRYGYQLVMSMVLATLPVAAAAQDQTEIVGGPRGGLTTVESAAFRGTDAERHAMAGKLIARTLGAAKARDEHGDWVDDPDFDCIIHVVEWTPGKQEIKAQRWFLYHPGAPLSAFESLRIYGSRKVGLLYVHLNVPGNLTGKLQVKATDKEPAREATVDEIAAGGVQPLDDGAFIKNFFARLSYRVDVVKKMPAPLADLGALVGLVQAATRELDLKDVDVWGGRVMEIRHVPSDVTARLLVTGAITQTELAKQTYDNEGKYRWDVSVAMPVTKLEQLKLDFENGLVTAKKIEKQGLIAVFNLFPMPIDTKGIRPSYVPHLLAGVSLSKKPLDTILLGAGIGINKAQIFAGVSWVRNDSGNGVAGGEPATTANAAKIRRSYDEKFIAGLNISVKQVVQALKK